MFSNSLSICVLHHVREVGMFQVKIQLPEKRYTVEEYKKMFPTNPGNTNCLADAESDRIRKFKYGKPDPQLSTPPCDLSWYNSSAGDHFFLHARPTIDDLSYTSYFTTDNARITSNVLAYMHRSSCIFTRATEKEILSSMD